MSSFKLRKRIVIGVTGSIGSGKSTVASMFAKLEAKIIDADEIAKQAYRQNPAILKKIVKVFGEELLCANGRLRREVLSQEAFADRGKVKVLNRIVHPYVLKRIKQVIRKSSGLIIVDAALLIESGCNRLVDYVLLLNCPFDLAVKRALRNHKLSKAQMRRRFALQLSFKDKRKKADFIINNRFSKSRLEKRVGEIYREVAK